MLFRIHSKQADKKQTNKKKKTNNKISMWHWLGVYLLPYTLIYIVNSHRKEIWSWTVINKKFEKV